MIRIRVIKNLNTRIGGAFTSFQKGLTRFPNEILLAEKKVKGENIGGNDLWYFDGKDKYYWSGGVVEIADAPVVETTTSGIDYRKQFTGLPQQWFSGNGKNVRIAVLDTGFFLDHPYLRHLKNTAVLSDTAKNGNTTDIEGHGSHVLGLLAAKSTNGLTGLCFEANYLLYKVAIDDVGMLDHIIARAIEDSILRNADIINLSLDVPSKENSILHQAIKKAQQKNILIVAAAGENNDLAQEALVYPAQFDGVIAVGAADKKFAAALQQPLNPALDFILPFIKHISCNNDLQPLHKELLGSSMSAALTTGVLASMLSSGIPKASLVAELKSKAKKFNNQSISSNELRRYTP